MERSSLGNALTVTSIVLATVNARFQHAAFGLRYLLANLGPLQDQTVVKEWSLGGASEREMVEQILILKPRIVALSVYIWNVEVLTSVARLLKQIEPSVVLVVGGPEVSFEWETSEIVDWADYLVRGEGDLVFAALCRQLLSGERPTEKVIAGGLPPLAELAWPYPHYTDFDLKHGRLIYVEASRGCPFQCHFCLSSLDQAVRSFPEEAFLEQLDLLLKRGVTHFKFVDRTFNLKTKTAVGILEFLWERYLPGFFFHFEMIPDRLPSELRPIIAQFPEGALQFEVGIQSFNPEVCRRIGRRQNFQNIQENLTFLVQETGVHIHADLIAGLPGEDLASFAKGFDQLHSLGVHEIQVGILKRLKGTPLTQADPEWAMVYSLNPPYEVVQTSHLSFFELQQLQRFARYWDLVSNSGRFGHLCRLLLTGISPFQEFLDFSQWLYHQSGQTFGISAKRLGEFLVNYLLELGVPKSQTDQAILLDKSAQSNPQGSINKRQIRHAKATA